MPPELSLNGSDLESFLQGQIEEGTLNSSGFFSLDASHAIAKLGNFQLPRETAWVLKVIQGVVNSGATHLNVYQTPTDTVLEFDPQKPWSLGEIEQALANPAPEVDPGLDHLKRGLWAVSIRGGRPFHYIPGASNGSLVWTGDKLRHLNVAPKPVCRLVVSHRSVEAGKGLPLLRDLQAQRTNSALLLEIAEHAYTCPIAFSLDGRRIDALPHCQEHGFTSTSYPLGLIAAQVGGLPTLPVPPATFGTFAKRPAADPYLIKLFQPDSRKFQQQAALCLVSFHVKMDENGGPYEIEREYDHVYWVQDGVIVSKRALVERAPRSVSCAIFASAEGIPLDLSGFALANEHLAQRHLYSICQTLKPAIQELNFNLTDLTSGLWKQRVAKGLGWIAAGVAGGLIVSPLLGLTGIATGSYNLLAATRSYQPLDASLRRGLELFKSDWK